MAESTFDSELDLSGEVCPYTLVKSKLALEKLVAGQILKITVDNNESAGNVPKGLSLDGHEILGVNREGKGKWHVTVKHAG